MDNRPLIVDIDFAQRRKKGQNTCGDCFVSSKIAAENRVISVLSDGLGSGIKANILSSMTATMALKFMEANRDIMRASEVIMDSLPVCQVRQISYATFSIVDTTLHGTTRIVEQGNPEFLLIRDGKIKPVKRQRLASRKWKDREISLSEFETKADDRLVVFSDGVSQAGLGNPKFKLGWRVEGCSKFLSKRVNQDSNVSARQLARDIVSEALKQEPQQQAQDDISCAVLYFRPPRKTLVVSGPPFDNERDGDVARMIKNFEGAKIICGGTTANIVSREIDNELLMDLSIRGGDLPPVSKMEGVDLITEGILTLTRTAQYLENQLQNFPKDAAGRLSEILLNSDQISFLIGTRINEAHQDPKLPIELEIRRNIIKRITAELESKFLKETEIKYI